MSRRTDAGADIAGTQRLDGQVRVHLADNLRRIPIHKMSVLHHNHPKTSQYNIQASHTRKNRIQKDDNGQGRASKRHTRFSKIVTMPSASIVA